MFKYDIEYENFDGEKVKETLNFHLTKAELIKMDLAKGGKLKDILEEVVTNQDPAETLLWFDKIIKASYGQREGDLFVKDPKKTEAFVSSEAYSEFFIKLINQEIKVEDFVLGIFPKDVATELAKEIK